MSLPSQQRRGAASGRASTRGIRKSRRRQGVPGPLKAAAAIALLAIVLWTGWAVLGPESTLAEGNPAPLSQTSGEPAGAEPDLANDPALDVIFQNQSARTTGNTGLIGEAIDNREPVRQAPLPEPLVIDSNPQRDQGDTGGDERERLDTANDPDPRQRVDNPPADRSGLTGADRAMADADVLGGQGRLVEARRVLNAALLASTTTEPQRAHLRQRMMSINADLVFGPRADPGDPMTEMYRVQPNDSLARIASRRELISHYKLIARVNGIKDPSKIRLDQNLKLVRGPFHGVVDKSDYRLDVYHGTTDDPGSWVYITSFPVGLGQNTPAGSFVISTNKLENPGWVNPFDGAERYDRNDPANPIGEFWLGLDGIGPSAEHEGFGLHGTTEPESIGRSMSMGCVRLADEHIATVYELLEEQISVVHIVE